MNVEPTENPLSIYNRLPPISAAAACGRDSRRHGILVEHSRDSSSRAEIEAFIRREFIEHFGATIKAFMPRLIAVHEAAGGVRAAVGCRGAGEGKLFLETYTRAPIEHAIGEKLGAAVPREQIVEVGSLACRNGRAAMEIVTALIPMLIGEGFTWVVFTGADTVRNVFRRLNLLPEALCAADKTLLGAAHRDWGSYYDHHPIVMAGRLADGIVALEADAGVQ
jgi:hypothetical protein